MTTITISPEVSLNLPSGYKPIPLPYFTEWVTALESGEYHQGKKRLCDNDGNYCCLGVLSKIQGRLTLDSTNNIYVDSGIGCSASLNPRNPIYPIIHAFGRFPNSIVGTMEYVGNFYDLAELNDLSVPFKDIAQVIKLIWKPIS